MRIDDAGRVHLVDAIPVLRPEEQIVEMMPASAEASCSVESLALLISNHHTRASNSESVRNQNHTIGADRG